MCRKQNNQKHRDQIKSQELRMRTSVIGLVTAVVLGLSSTAFAANRTYYLDLPVIQLDPQTLAYRASGSITTDGAFTPTDADIVDYKITLSYSGSSSGS